MHGNLLSRSLSTFKARFISAFRARRAAKLKYAVSSADQYVAVNGKFRFLRRIVRCFMDNPGLKSVHRAHMHSKKLLTRCLSRFEQTRKRRFRIQRYFMHFVASFKESIQERWVIAWNPGMSMTGIACLQAER
jgi:hypothetical protein